MKLIGSTKKSIGKIKNAENVPPALEVVSVQCSLVTSYLVVLKICNTDFDEIFITFMNQNGKPLEIEYKVNLKLFINK